MQTIKFSIIMPTYNREFCLKTAIISALNQTYQDFELIIIDDASTDNTEEKIKEKFSAEIKSGKIIYHKLIENGGVCHARNIGLTLAKNAWIAYLDSDNQMRENHLDTFKNAIEKNPQNLCFYAKVKHQKSELIIGREFNYVFLRMTNYIDMGVFVHHRGIYEKLGGFSTSLKRLVDWDLILTYTKEFTPIFINKILLNYNDDDKISRITNAISLDENMQKIYEKHSINPAEFPKISANKNGIKKRLLKILSLFIPFKRLRKKLRNI